MKIGDLVLVCASPYDKLNGQTGSIIADDISEELRFTVDFGDDHQYFSEYELEIIHES